MKILALLPATAAVILALGISPASSQQACMKDFQACMDGCTKKSAKAIQDTCFHGCENKNTMCAERVYGKRPFNGTPQPVAASAEPKDAMAKTEPAAEPEQAPEPRKQPSRTTPQPRR
jgi:hypothetical protein